MSALEVIARVADGAHVGGRVGQTVPVRFEQFVDTAQVRAAMPA
jgi:hypothetical protein